MKIEGSFYRIWNWVTNLFLLNLLWLLTIFLGVGIPFGAATVAGFQIARKMVSLEEVDIIKDYFSYIRKNFITNTLHGLSIIGILFFLIYQFFLLQSVNNNVIKIIYFGIFLLFFIFISYIFPIISRFETTFFNYWKSSLLLSILHPWTSIKIVSTIIGIIAIQSIHPAFVVITISFYFVSIYFHLSSVIKKMESQIEIHPSDRENNR